MKRLTITALLFCSLASFAQKREKYTLFRPVPRQELRDMETDRPDVTESPFTVDAGHFQLETDLFKRMANSNHGTKTIDRVYNAMNVKAGLTGSTDLQLLIDTYTTTTARSAGNTDQRSATFAEDLTIRLKHNLFGNDNGKVALSAMPYVTLPFSNGGYAAGIVFPLAVDLGGDWGFGSQVQATHQHVGSGETEYLASATIGKDLSGKFNLFVEGVTTYATLDKRTRFLADMGLTFSLSPDVRFDAGFNYGITKVTDRLYFTGFSFRY